ncbi:MAG: antibiotic biosynthesis monooxygenase [Chloroflexaceae bacterium]|jgi:heme-degrading monooxygenase HmoA|nr:antibiotic biosynthesis monooxygenase [Chloroflexaceae bacterium]
MITTANRIFVHEEYAEQFETNFRNRAGLVDGMPGFIANQLLRPVNQNDPYIVLTWWESREHFEAWVRSDEFKLGHARSGSLPKEAFSAPNKLEMHEVLTDTSRPDLPVEPRGGAFRVH